MEDQTSGVKPWDKLPNEPDAAYARFLVYLRLGRTRSLDAAYAADRGTAPKRAKTRQPSGARRSGTWSDDCATYRWTERALAYDIDALTSKGYETVIDFVNTLAILANKTVKALADEKIKPRGLKAIVEMVNVLGSYIPAETVAAVRADAEQRRISAIGHSHASPPDSEHPTQVA